MAEHVRHHHQVLVPKVVAGHYEPEVIEPETRFFGVHEIEVTVKKRGAVVMAGGTYVDKP